MPKLNLTNPIHYERAGITVYRRAMSDSLCRDISHSLFHLVADTVAEVTMPGENVRGFRSSPVLSLGSVPVLEAAITDTFSDRFTTMRVNVQGPKGRQGWHQDYIPEPIVLYPEGEGFIDLNPDAKTVEEARRLTSPEAIISVPVVAGDMAVLERGGELFHRGRNASAEQPRLTTVLH